MPETTPKAIWERTNDIYLEVFQGLVLYQSGIKPLHTRRINEGKILINEERTFGVEARETPFDQQLTEAEKYVGYEGATGPNKILYTFTMRGNSGLLEFRSNEKGISIVHGWPINVPENFLYDTRGKTLVEKLTAKEMEIHAEIVGVKQSHTHLIGIYNATRSGLENQIVGQLLEDSETSPTAHITQGIRRTTEFSIKTIEELETFYRQLSPEFLWSLIPPAPEENPK